MQKTKKKQKELLEVLSFDSITNKCIDKVEIISLVHGTGHITLITQQGIECKIRLSKLIEELKIDQNKSIIKAEATIFEDVVLVKYPQKRSEEFDKIVSRAKLFILTTRQTELGCFEAMVQVSSTMKQLEEIETVV